MSNTTKNSLSTLLSQFMRLNRNALEIFERINEAVTTNKETVDVDLFDDDNNIRKIQVPSFGYLKHEITRLDKNLTNLSGLGENSTSIKLADGSVRKILTSQLKGPAKNITNVESPIEFHVRNNWFFEDLLNPLLYIKLDITNQIPNDTEKVMTRTYMLILDTERKKDFFEKELRGKSDLDYVEFNKMILNEGIQIILDDDIRDLPPRQIKYDGYFDILDVQNKEFKKLVDGREINIRRKQYRLNKLTYTDLDSGFPDTMGLKEGDSLVVNSEILDTRYKIEKLDSSTNTIILEKIEGYRGLSIGINKLKIYKENESSLNIEIPVDFDKYKVVFIKTIDNHSNMPAVNWSPGFAFYTNDLMLNTESGNPVDLSTYYQNEVSDFGTILLSLAKDGIVPASLGLIPNVPEINESDLKVTQINNHITDNEAIEEIKKLSDERKNLQSEIRELDKAISEKQSKISTRQYNSTIERDKDRSEFNSLVDDRASKSKLFSSIVEEISSKIKAEKLLDVKAKYRIRGFVPIPKPRKSKYTGSQEIVAIEYQYRYIDTAGNANKVEQFSKNDNNSHRIGAQSNWIKGELITRNKIEDPDTGQMIWETQRIEDPEQLNINQIDIPIQKGESVEIRVRSISEAGFPSNPVKSQWSEIKRIDFPDNIIQTDTVSKIASENDKEEQRVKLEKELIEKGVIVHIDDQFVANEKLFKHDALNIFSGELTAEQTPISLFEKLQNLTIRLEKCEEILNRVKGELIVKILDESGNETIVEKDNITKLFAGYYAEQVKDLDIKKGAIISKTYFIVLENRNATTLELISRISGNRNDRAYSSGTPNFGNTPAIDNAVISDNYYTTRGKYDIVPLLYTNPSNVIPDYINNSPFQSSQKNGQFIYARYMNVSNSEEFYVSQNISGNEVRDLEYDISNLTAFSGNGTQNDYIWKGNFTGNNLNTISLVNANTQLQPAKYSDPDVILLHTLHPDIQAPNNVVSMNTNRIVTNSKLANLSADALDGKKQYSYLYADGDFNIPVNKRTVKCAFVPADQYTLGGGSVGCYMFLAPDNESTLNVNGDDNLSNIEIEYGPGNSIKIPVVFQYRMTDFAGVGDSTGIGFIGGDDTQSTKNLKYAKRMGFDIITFDGTKENRFSFDLEISAKYKSDNLNLNKIPVKSINTAILNLSKNLGSISPDVNVKPSIGVIK